jgi:hyperosmotically inducible periplasmic protein
MRTRTMIFLAIMTLVGGCVERTQQAVDDVALTAKVKTGLAGDSETSAMKVGVNTDRGVVTLSGVVPTEREKMKAEQIARRTEGVTQVVNNITIDPNTIGATNIKEKTEEAVSDTTILSKIKAKLLLEQITGTDVDVSNGVVTLKGQVADQKQVTQAAEIARTTNGVKSVKNQLTVKK